VLQHEGVSRRSLLAGMAATSFVLLGKTPTPAGGHIVLLGGHALWLGSAAGQWPSCRLSAMNPTRSVYLPCVPRPTDAAVVEVLSEKIGTGTHPARKGDLVLVHYKGES
jgi:hypothetical protein